MKNLMPLSVVLPNADVVAKSLSVMRSIFHASPSSTFAFSSSSWHCYSFFFCQSIFLAHSRDSSSFKRWIAGIQCRRRAGPEKAAEIDEDIGRK